MLIRVNIDIEDVDYKALIDALSKQKVTPSLAIKAIILKARAKFKNKNQTENDQAFTTLLNSNNEKITIALNAQLIKHGANGFFKNINAEIVDKKDVFK